MYPAARGKCLSPPSPDTNQALRLCLGTKTTGAEFGAVSALSINHDCSRLLCGFAKGQVQCTVYSDTQSNSQRLVDSLLISLKCLTGWKQETDDRFPLML